MNTFDLNTLPCGGRVHFIGIGGISMSGLAEILLGRGYKISGSDMKESPITQKLRTLGAEIYIGQKAENIHPCDLIVYTAAIKEDNEEYIAAVRSGIKLIDRAALLGAVMRAYKHAVAIAGTHGKTSTTSMMTHIMLAAGADPTVSLGGELPAIDGNIRVGKSDSFVCEACEYHGSFLKFFPFVSVILNIEEDHLDYFRDIEHIKETFRGFAELVPEDGAVVADIDGENVRAALRGIKKNVITCSYDSENADYHAADISYNSRGEGSFTLFEKGKPLGTITLSVPGKHNVSNAVCAAAAARFLGIPFDAVKRGLLSYSGVHRRFEYKGERNGVTVIDDYAHHPTEIEATLKTAANMKGGTVWCVFQPHTYTRTKKLFGDFVRVLGESGAKVIMLDIFAAREKDTGLVSSKELSDATPGSRYMPGFRECADFLRQNAKSGDIVITMGAGDVYKVGDLFLSE